ncbi:MAG: carbohydrate kinase family protein [Kosmotoga sp.]|nr:MAG: carbohydrate kinase family protein [Kosmotoga sp.]
MKIGIIGATVWDHYIVIKNFPEEDSLVFAENEFKHIGGSGANIAINLGLHQINPHLFFGIGDDNEGEFLNKILKKCGVITHSTIEGKTCKTLILLNEKGQRRIISLGGNALFKANNEKFDDFGIMCISDVFPDVAERVFKNTISLKIYIPGGFGIYCGVDKIRKISRLANITILSEKEAEKIKDYSSLCNIVIVTRGRKNTRLFSNNSYKEFIVNNVDNVVDTTGAGDAFVSGLVYYLSNSRDIVRAIQYGHKWASSVIQKMGANFLSHGKKE